MNNRRRKTLDATFGELLCSLRREKGLSQEELGFESGRHRTYISQLERGLKTPTLDTLFALGRALSVSPAEIVAEIERKIS